MDKFVDRQYAGTILAKYLAKYTKQANAIVLALPRGGIPVAFEIALALSIPLDIFTVRKLGVPGQEEVAMGAIASGDIIIFNEILMKQLHMDPAVVDGVLKKEQVELRRREYLYRGDRPFPSLANKTVILVDDGIATGASMRAAVVALRKHKPSAIIVAVPVADYDAYQRIKKMVDKMICPLIPNNFIAVGEWYDNFSQVSDREAIAFLERSNLNEQE
ncbi:MAG: phosphoribosyl transferase [Legionella sp. 40-6]|nr:phosphoribosyltransferase [Legionella sp.]OJY10749.1 MAG: phosphoribosyl transferase [Legionella sp. 40-6]